MSQFTDANSCPELCNIKYKTMLLNGNIMEMAPKYVNSNLSSIEKILEDESKNNTNESWCKLNKTDKIKKLYDYANNIGLEKKLSEIETRDLKLYLINLLDKKKLTRVKEVKYNITTGNIESIPSLVFNDGMRKFTLKKLDKKSSIAKCLGPGKTRKIKSDKIDVNI